MTDTVLQPLMSFEVLEGLHYERKPGVPVKQKGDTHAVFKKGDVVHSAEDLEKKHTNKFRRVRQDDAPPPPSPERVARVDTLVAEGVWAEDDRAFLQGLKDQDFDRILRMGRMPISTEPKVGLLGEDVTHLFQRAYDEGFRVWKNAAGKHQVTKAGESGKPLNPKPLESGGVDKFVETYLREK